ncbi:MAG: MFS transporter [Chloroflexota bacterium]
MNRDMRFLMVSLFAWGIGEGMFFLFVPNYLEELGASPLLIGTVLGIFGVMVALPHIPAGYIADKFGRRPLMRFAWLSGMAAAWVMALAGSLPLFVSGLFMYGLTALVSAPLSSYVTAARGKMTVGRALTFTSGVYNLGMVLGPISGGWVGDRLGLRSIFFFSAVLFVVSSVVLFLLRPQPTDEHEPGASSRDLFGNSRYLGFLALSLAVTFAIFLPQPLTSVFLVGERGLTYSRIGLLGTFGGLGNSLLTVGLGSLRSARNGYILAQAAAGLFPLLIWKGSSLPVYALGYFMLGGFRATRSLATAQVRSLIQASQMGLAYGITETINSLPTILAPPLAGYLYSRDPAMIYPLALACAAAAVVLSMLFAPRPAADHQPAAIPAD